MSRLTDFAEKVQVMREAQRRYDLYSGLKLRQESDKAAAKVDAALLEILQETKPPPRQERLL